jgi:cell division protein FtsQ
VPPAEERLEDRAAPIVVLPDATPDPVRSQLPRWARWAVAVGVAVALGGVAYLFSRSAFFAIDDIVVVGNAHLKSGHVIRETGIPHDGNVLAVDLEAVEARLERDPWIASAIVERSLPGTITIQVHERVAVAAVERSGAFDLVAADGTVLGVAADAARLPVIRFSAVSSQPTVAGPAAIVGALDPDAREVVTFVDVDALGAITIELRSGTTVRFGTATQVPSKAAALGAMLSFAQDNRVHLISVDLRFPGAPSAVMSDGSRFEP